MSDRPPRWSERRAIGGWKGEADRGGGTWRRGEGERIYKLEKLFLASRRVVVEEERGERGERGERTRSKRL